VVPLDNIDTPTLRQAVDLVAGRLVMETSGNMALSRIAEAAAMGGNYISVGLLTHSARTLDRGLDF
jgi:nicotinate-nucleotide pyrophosphorylase (carboxylating)